MPREQYDKNQMYEYCHQFYSYLQIRQLTTEPTTKEKLRDVYVRDFKPNVQTKLPCFSMVMFNMKRLKFVSIRDNEMVSFLCTLALGPDESIPQNKNSDASKKEKKKKKKKLPQVMLSVDQHLALKNKSKSEKFTTSSYFCRVCNVRLSGEADIQPHRNGNKHKLNCCMMRLEMEMSNMISNKHNIRIETREAFDEAEGTFTLHLECNKDKRVMLQIHNDEKKPVTLTLCEALQYFSHCELDDPNGVAITKSSVTIKPGSKYEILAKCSSSEPGLEKIPILFCFTMANDKFMMMRHLLLDTQSEFTEELAPTAPYKPPPRASLKFSANRIVRGRRLAKYEFDELKLVLGLKPYDVPMTLRTLTNHGLKPFVGMSEKLNKELKKLLESFEKPLSAKNYKRFQTLLYLEEIQMEVDMRKYDMDDACMKIAKDNRQFFSLVIPGLAEQRPSILKGDCLYVEKKSSTDRNDVKEYEGFVHKINGTELCVAFDDGFHSTYMNGGPLKIRFTPNRTPIRLQHRAVSLAKTFKLGKLIFPDGQNVPKIDSDPKLLLFDKELESNKEQLRAIEMIVAGSSGPNPYVIFGPPGTGKTVTLVEAMKQVVKSDDKCHILACASCNTAADLITQRLLKHVSRSKVFRMYALSRSPALISEDILKVSNYDKKTGKFFYPTKGKLMEFQFIITTLITAGRLAGAVFPAKHFTHVFIDEAGQATEPEALIAIAGILDTRDKNNHGQLILAGDPKQLGPIIKSPTAVKNGLEVSFLERLMQTNQVYQRANGNDFDSRFITKLLQNYRSHPSILKVPNELFYENELQERADKSVTSALCRWTGLPKQDFPVIFHSIISKEEREGRNPSFYNVAEVSVVVNYVTELLSSRRAGINVKPSSIGIISPYNQQVHKIRKALKLQQSRKKSNGELKGIDLTQVTVGCTEEYQGQEKLIIIISTVRSDPNLLQVDNKFRLGFLRNPKRFNVAMTRAKALLIVVGNPHVLVLDANWKRFIEHCQENNAMAGIPFSPKKDIDHLIEQFMMCDIGKDIDMSALDEEMLSTINQESNPGRSEA